MGTRSTVKFYQDSECILSVYQQYDGYPSGVGRQIVGLLETYQIVNGIPLRSERKFANGFSELALFYVLDNKDGSGNIYATTERDSQEYNYEIYANWRSEDTIDKIKVISEFEGLLFDGTPKEFIDFVENQ